MSMSPNITKTRMSTLPNLTQPNIGTSMQKPNLTQPKNINVANQPNSAQDVNAAKPSLT